jgi:hypothetical protein
MNYEMFYGIGALILLLGMAWAVIDYKRRNRANDKLSEEATRQQYNDPDRYQDQVRPELERKVKPN